MTASTAGPSGQGVNPAGVLAFIDGLEADRRIEPHGLIIQRHGQRVVEGHWAPHTPDRCRLVYSLSKSFTGTALGLQIGEGRLTLDDLVADHLPELFHNAGPRARRLRIRHIASMSTGHDREMLLEARAADPDDLLRGFFGIEPDQEPGTLFAYNQPPVLALATILQRLAGERLVDYLRPRVLDPLGIPELDWVQHRPGIDLGFSGVHTTLDAVARLGQLYLDDGVWNGRRVLPDGWVADASRRHIDNSQREEPDWQQGYGFQLWMSQHGYRGDGAFGQYMLVLPEYDAVVALFSCTENMQAILDLAWEHLLPAMTEISVQPDGSGAALAERLGSLSLPTAAARHRGSAMPAAAAPAGGAMSYLPGEPTATSHRTVRRIDVTGDGLVLHEDEVSIAIPLTPEWTTFPGGAIAASAAQLGDGRTAVDLVFLDTPHRLEITLDAATATFQASWPIVPLFGAGLGSKLGAIRRPGAG
jgi:CubicO group peptidase (beta-lactamase class C family)